MPEKNIPILTSVSPEHRRVAAGQFERANQVIATGNFDYGISLLFTCCKLDPANLIYRQALRRTEKTKFKNNLRGSWHARFSTLSLRTKLKGAPRARGYNDVAAKHMAGVEDDQPASSRARVATPPAGEVPAVAPRPTTPPKEVKNPGIRVPTPSPEVVPSAERGAREAANVRARIEADP